jgi:hypothetical protein
VRRRGVFFAGNAQEKRKTLFFLFLPVDQNRGQTPRGGELSEDIRFLPRRKGFRKPRADRRQQKTGKGALPSARQVPRLERPKGGRGGGKPTRSAGAVGAEVRKLKKSVKGDSRPGKEGKRQPASKRKWAAASPDSVLSAADESPARTAKARKIPRKRSVGKPKRAAYSRKKFVRIGDRLAGGWQDVARIDGLKVFPGRPPEGDGSAIIADGGGPVIEPKNQAIFFRLGKRPLGRGFRD